MIKSMNQKYQDTGVSRAYLVRRCFVLLDFNEELPLYICDVGSDILILFGQWMYDPHTLIAPREVFDAWDPGKAMFQQFAVEWDSNSGDVARLTVVGNEFIQVSPLTEEIDFNRLRECQISRKHTQDLVRSLEIDGIIRLRLQSSQT